MSGTKLIPELRGGGIRFQVLPSGAQAVQEEMQSTTEGAIGGGTIGGWIAQALRMRPRLLAYPAGLI